MTSKSKQAEDIIRSVPPRDDRAALQAFGLLRELYAPAHAIPCPACGYLCDPREAGTHIRSGYRTHILPPKPGSWMAENATDD